MDNIIERYRHHPLHHPKQTISRCAVSRGLRRLKISGLVAAIALSVQLEAATFQVTHSADTGPGSLRQATVSANANPGPDIVQFTATASGTLLLSGGVLNISDDLQIEGPGVDLLTIDGAGAQPLFEVNGATLTLAALRLSNAGGNAINADRAQLLLSDTVIQGSTGFGLRLSNGDLTIDDSLIVDNVGGGIELQSSSGRIRGSRVSDNSGAGVDVSDGHVRVLSSEIAGNATGIRFDTADVYLEQVQVKGNSQGGLIGSVRWRTIDLIDSRITNNGGPGVQANQIQCLRSQVAGNAGHGLHAFNPAGFTIAIVEDCTIASNQANGVNFVATETDRSSVSVRNSTLSGNHGSGLHVMLAGQFVGLVRDSTITDNARLPGTSGIHAEPLASDNGSYEIGIENSIIAANNELDLGGSQVTYALSYALIQHHNVADAYAILETVPDSNLFGTDPGLGPLTNNGGTLPTHALAAHSPATNAGRPENSSFSPLFDQRGVGHARVAGANMDIGAFELQQSPANGYPFRITAIDPADGNNIPEIALLRHVGAPFARLPMKDAITREALPLRSIGGWQTRVVDFAGSNDIDGNGAGEAVVLFSRPSGQGVAMVRDGGLGWFYGLEVPFFGAGWRVIAITTLDVNGDGRDDAAVLAESPDGLQASVQIRELREREIGPQIQWINFPYPSGSELLGLTAVPDSNGNSVDELAVLQRSAEGTVRVYIKDSLSKEPLASVGFGQASLEPIDIVSVKDINGNGSAEIALLLRKANGQGIVQLRDSVNGEWLHQIRFLGQAWEAVALAGHDIDADGVSELSVLGAYDDGTALGVQIRDALSGDEVNWIGFDVH